MTDVVMPQMGESITEGTITRWLKSVGDMVQRDEPLLEISTDKVDAEIPAPASGRLGEILVEEGATVAVQTVLARIEAADEQALVAPRPEPPEPNADPGPPVVTKPMPPPLLLDAPSEEGGPEAGLDELRRTRSSPLVRRIAAEHQVDLSLIRGTGLGGRVTKEDILAHLQLPGTAAPEPPATPPPLPSPSATPPILATAVPEVEAALPVSAQREQLAPAPARSLVAGPRDEIVPLTPIRRRTAEHMVASRRTAAHATTLFEVDMTRVEQLRSAYKRVYHERGAALTYLPFVLKATVDALKAHPVVNASLDGDRVIYHRDINLGIAVALERGLIVPVLRGADEKNVLGLARALGDLVERARSKRLTPDELHGGTFTVTNPGVFGSLFGTPIIHQPQVAILAVGVVEKRPVVRDDAIAIRSLAYLALSFDHRLIDGADADRFMGQLKRGLQEFDESAL
jgi:pyruvate dehydrogenase E2 component (dihydrolipoamide acetyltransferase)